MRRNPIRALVLFFAGLHLAGAAVATTPPTQTQPEGHAGTHDATVHHSFADADSWAKTFDDPERDTWQKPAEVVKALDLKAGMVAADLGAGTGYFSRFLSAAVSPGGMVLAIDVEPSMVQHLGERARLEKLGNLLPVLALPDDPFLPKGRVDRILIVDTYHHIDSRLEYFSRMREAMSPVGKVAIVDFHKRPLPVGPPPEHKLEIGFVVQEMEQAGWKLTEQKDFLPYQYFLVFEPMRR
jgi:predicted methyltransferase